MNVSYRFSKFLDVSMFLGSKNPLADIFTELPCLGHVHVNVTSCHVIHVSRVPCYVMLRHVT